LLLLVLIVLLSYQGYRHYKAKILKKEQAYRQLIAEYEKTQQEYQQKCNDLELLQQNLKILRQITTAEASAVAEATEKELRRRDEELEEYRIRITEYEARIGLPKALEKEEFLNRFHIVRKCRAFVEHKETEGITTKDLNKVLQIYEGHYSRVYARLEEARLSHQEILVSVLLLLNFDTYQIVQLLGKSPQSITNSKTKANRKLFHQESADSLYRNLKRLFWCNLV
ncbi:MAG: hypothetical protein J6Y39_02225, partial [Bacteroidaceae bacterium]|nr:hypothetical protein [Bacteroidaceae bacterium]